MLACGDSIRACRHVAPTLLVDARTGVGWKARALHHLCAKTGGRNVLTELTLVAPDLLGL